MPVGVPEGTRTTTGMPACRRSGCNVPIYAFGCMTATTMPRSIPPTPSEPRPASAFVRAKSFCSASTTNCCKTARSPSFMPHSIPRHYYRSLMSRASDTESVCLMGPRTWLVMCPLVVPLCHLLKQLVLCSTVERPLEVLGIFGFANCKSAKEMSSSGTCIKRCWLACIANRCCYSRTDL
ncbi:hypothetical protein DAEQUDRAFT_109235 [Daedalea quercina L-15889]|uniref:Uncharacterized protein n=1 Tax=Daedalea quercina L-15889 TaxID=1314783 RepID=A0A165S447_9APHY|nr:hypothetical protein DAEQUDRAFT_109235 [Daedalea quercina L-15889]